jgi:hypothetical protein
MNKEEINMIRKIDVLMAELSSKDAEIQSLRTVIENADTEALNKLSVALEDIQQLREHNTGLKAEIKSYEYWVEHEHDKEVDEYQKEIQQLKHWKESAMSVWPDMQKIGDLIGVKLGGSVHDKIIPAIEKMQSEIQHLKSSRVKDIEDAITEGMDIGFDEGHGIINRVEANNKRLEYLKPFTADSK